MYIKDIWDHWWMLVESCFGTRLVNEPLLMAQGELGHWSENTEGHQGHTSLGNLNLRAFVIVYICRAGLKHPLAWGIMTSRWHRLRDVCEFTVTLDYVYHIRQAAAAVPSSNPRQATRVNLISEFKTTDNVIQDEFLSHRPQKSRAGNSNLVSWSVKIWNDVDSTYIIICK